MGEERKGKVEKPGLRATQSHNMEGLMSQIMCGDYKLDENSLWEALRRSLWLLVWRPDYKDTTRNYQSEVICNRGWRDQGALDSW